jgi:TonB family protein
MRSHLTTQILFWNLWQYLFACFIFPVRNDRMKPTGILFLLLFGLTASAQKNISYYDWRWQPCEPALARFYSTLEHTDSGWLRYDFFMASQKVQMKALYEDEACKIETGLEVHAYANGGIETIGKKIKGKQEGICLSYYSNGMMYDSANYHDGRNTGIHMRWWPDGMPQDSIVRINDSTEIQVSWFNNGSPSEAGYWLNDRRNGKWKFFHKNGGLAAQELFDHGRLIDKQYFEEDGSARVDTNSTDRAASFKGGLKGWQSYLENKLFWPNGLMFSNGTQAVVVVQLAVDEDGKVSEVEVITPFHPTFDKIALDVVRKSPNWQPAIQDHRRVYSLFRQPVTFRQEE